jgi:hypothetical protein
MAAKIMRTIKISDVDTARLTGRALVERLVDNGISRLTAERFVALERDNVEAGRARPHTQARR